MSLLRKFTIALLVLIGAMLLEGYFNGPNPWILKYDFSGRPIASIGREYFVFWMSVFFVFTNSIVLVVTYFVGSDPSLKSVNIPNKEYWERPENSSEALRRINLMMDSVLIFINTIILATVGFTRLNLMGMAVNFLLLFVVAMIICLSWTTYNLFTPRA